MSKTIGIHANESGAGGKNSSGGAAGPIPPPASGAVRGMSLTTAVLPRQRLNRQERLAKQKKLRRLAGSLHHKRDVTR